MIDLYPLVARAFLFRLDPEKAHELALQALRLHSGAALDDDPRLRVDAFGLAFANPVGLAAGLDKNAKLLAPLARLGFGFIEVGTVTPRPQSGNARPRLFRLTEDEAVINRLGFNNEGQAQAAARLAAATNRGVVGVNIGANKDSLDRPADYVACIEALAPFVSYFTVNVSSPNTPGLRDLQEARLLDELLARVIDARDRVAERHGRRPLLVKIAPDVPLDGLDDIVRVLRARAVDGLIVTNTTLARPATLKDKKTAAESGGLSGRPLFEPATRVLAAAYLRIERQFPLIGVGGIDSAATAFAKFEAGASLVQLYSALVFKGPALIGTIKRGLLQSLARRGCQRLEDVTGIAAADWAAGKIDAASVR